VVETAWLIEFPADQNGAVYYGKTVEGLGQTNENLDAVRFARREDAELIIADVGWTEAKAVEHMWIDDKPAV
jgi:hypothetical protein